MKGPRGHDPQVETHCSGGIFSVKYLSSQCQARIPGWLICVLQAVSCASLFLSHRGVGMDAFCVGSGGFSTGPYTKHLPGNLLQQRSFA